MPIRLHTDKATGKKYYQWGHHAKYYFTTEREKKLAYTKALKQAVAAHANGYRGK
jgi:hypothetical protein